MLKIIKIPKKKKGVTEIFLATAISVFVLLAVVFVSIVDIKPFFISMELRNASRQAILRMETDGGLTNQTRQEILKYFTIMPGFNSNNLEITASNNADNSSFANYGDPVKLTLKYNYTPKRYSLVGWTHISTATGTTLPLSSTVETTSKRIQLIDH